ncbi:MAG TPA: chorismate mutase [Terriglobales bacterium]|nr:chorismate mutase [Terriglobales bacterium]
MDIAGWRAHIDEIDRQVVQLLNERCRCALAIGQLKRDGSLPVYEPRREAAIMENVARHNTGPLSDRALRLIFERIIDEMRAVQKYEMLAADNPMAQDHTPEK